MTRFWDGRTDRRTDGQTDGVTALLDLLSPSATQVKIVTNCSPFGYIPQGTKLFFHDTTSETPEKLGCLYTSLMFISLSIIVIISLYEKCPKEQVGIYYFQGGGGSIWLPQKRCLVLPTCNADSGRKFSMLKKIQTDMRSKLKNDTKCASVVTCTKQNQESEC